MVWAILSSIAVQLLVIYTPVRSFFGTVAIKPFDWIYIIGVSVSILFFIEIFKLIVKNGRTKKSCR